MGERLGERLDRAGRDHISVTVRCLTLYVWGIVARRTRRAGERVRVRDGELETCDWKVESRSEELSEENDELLPRYHLSYITVTRV